MESDIPPLKRFRDSIDWFKGVDEEWFKDNYYHNPHAVSNEYFTVHHLTGDTSTVTKDNYYLLDCGLSVLVQNGTFTVWKTGSPVYVMRGNHQGFSYGKGRTLEEATSDYAKKALAYVFD